MQLLAIFLMVLLMTACAGGPGKLERPTAYSDTKGNPVSEEVTESSLIAEAWAAAVKQTMEEDNPCGNFTAEEIAQLKEGGQQFHFMSQMMCQYGRAMAMAVMAARDRPTTAQGEVAYEGRMAIAGVETSDAAETGSKNNLFKAGLITLGTVWAVDSVAGALAGAGASYTTVQDSNFQLSNSGESSAGEGGTGQGGDRNMALTIGGDTNFQPGDSNTQATAEKATSVDNPIVSGGPENAIVNDSDANDNDARLF